MFSTRPLGISVGCDPPMMLMLPRIAMSRSAFSEAWRVATQRLDRLGGIQPWSSIDSSCGTNISGTPRNPLVVGNHVDEILHERQELFERLPYAPL